MRAFLPALLLAISAFVSGGLAGGATFAGAAVGHTMLLLCAWLAVPRLADPLELGRGWRWLVPLLVLAVALSWTLSPVSRAGRVGVVLLPAWLLLPAAVAGCWPDRRSRARGTRAISAVIAVVALYALSDRWLGGATRAAVPLGHHTALAGWLLLTWPLTLAVGARTGRGWRWTALFAAASATTGLWATGSLAAIGCWLLQAAALAALLQCRRRLAAPATSAAGGAVGRFRWWLLPAASAVALVAIWWRRIFEMLAGLDPSARARWTYLEGGFRGWLERPVVGWGPGSVPWTVGEFLRPRTGVNPPGEVVGDLHSLPLQLGYELGVVGWVVIVALTAVFLRRRAVEASLRWRGAAGSSRSAMLAAGSWIAIAGGLLFGFTHAALFVTALPVAAAVAAGAGLAASSGERRAIDGVGPEPAADPGASRVGRRRWVMVAYTLIAVAALGPTLLAHLHYDRAVSTADPRRARSALRRAEALDPDFPLYRARRAWLDREIADDRGGVAAFRSAARDALSAAASAQSVGALWLAAGDRAMAVDPPAATAALARACRLDRLGAAAPYLLAVVSADRRHDGAAAAGARSLAADPRMAAGLLWEDRPALAAAASRMSQSWPGVPDERRRSVARELDRSVGRTGSIARMVIEIDRDPALSLSLYAFRRRPWPARLTTIEVRTDRFRAAGRRWTGAALEAAPEAFEEGCEVTALRPGD